MRLLTLVRTRCLDTMYPINAYFTMVLSLLFFIFFIFDINFENKIMCYSTLILIS